MWVKRRVFVDLADRVQCETKIPRKAGSCFSSSECTQKTIARDILCKNMGLISFVSAS